MRKHQKHGKINYSDDLMEKIMIGFRQYSKNEEDQKVLEMQCKDARKYFPNSYVVVALCGIKLVNENIADKVIHYSDKPLGFTRPLYELLKFAKENNFNQLILCDGDDQHIFSELRKAYEDGLKKKSDVVLPIRKNRNLFFEGKEKIDRIVLEDLENESIRILLNIKFKDIQPGTLIVLNKKVIDNLNLENVPNWIGDFVLVEKIKDFKVFEPEIKVREQKITTVNLGRIFTQMKELEQYFNFSFLDIFNTVKNNIEKKSNRDISDAINEVKKEYEGFSL